MPFVVTGTRVPSDGSASGKRWRRGAAAPQHAVQNSGLSAVAGRLGQAHAAQLAAQHGGCSGAGIAARPDPYAPTAPGGPSVGSMPIGGFVALSPHRGAGHHTPRPSSGGLGRRRLGGGGPLGGASANGGAHQQQPRAVAVGVHISGGQQHRPSRGGSAAGFAGPSAPGSPGAPQALRLEGHSAAVTVAAVRRPTSGIGPRCRGRQAEVLDVLGAEAVAPRCGGA